MKSPLLALKKSFKNFISGSNFFCCTLQLHAAEQQKYSCMLLYSRGTAQLQHAAVACTERYSCQLHTVEVQQLHSKIVVVTLRCNLTQYVYTYIYIYIYIAIGNLSLSNSSPSQGCPHAYEWAVLGSWEDLKIASKDRSW